MMEATRQWTATVASEVGRVLSMGDVVMASEVN
jgi:hypothetical protein